MMYFDWFVRIMKNTFQTEVPPIDVSYEEFDYYHEDLDDLLIPAKYLVKLPNPLILGTYSCVDKHGYEWIAGVVKEEKTERLLYEVWIR